MGFNKLVGHVSSRDAVLDGIHLPASNTAAVITLAAVANKKHVIQGVQWSYSGTPTGSLTIAKGATTKWSADITSAGPGGFTFMLPGNTNEDLVVTLAAGGAGVTGKLNIQYTTESINSK